MSYMVKFNGAQKSYDIFYEGDITTLVDRIASAAKNKTTFHHTAEGVTHIINMANIEYVSIRKR